jgi:hypothetical protein
LCLSVAASRLERAIVSSRYASGLPTSTNISRASVAAKPPVTQLTKKATTRRIFDRAKELNHYVNLSISLDGVGVTTNVNAADGF